MENKINLSNYRTCTNRIKDKSGFFDKKTCKTKLHNLRTICSFKRNIKPPFKKGWVKQYSLCNTKILKPKLECNYSFDKTGKTMKAICKKNNKICTYSRNIVLPEEYKVGEYAVSAMCRTRVLKKGKSVYFPSKLKCKHTLNKTGKIVNSVCKKKTNTIMRECTYSDKKVHLGKIKVKCNKTKNKSKQSKRKQSKSKQSKSKRKTLRGGTVNPIAEIGSMFGTLGSSLQSVVSSLTIPPATAFNPSLPISADPSKQFINNNLTQPISTIYK
jgi:hypothetical protein